jgi:cystathionine beta-lyase
MAAADNPLERLTLADLRKRTSAKWRVYPRDVLPMWVAEMDTPLAEPIAAALREAIDLGDTGYAAAEDYARTLADFASHRWGWRVPIADVRVVPDVMRGIVEILRLITVEGDPVVVTTPVYPPFFAFVAHAGRRIVQLRLTDAGRIDLDALDESLKTLAAAHRHVALLISNPHNPTGVVHTRAELEVIAELARTHGTRVISDEIHAPLVLDGATFTPYLSVRGSEDAFTLTSASKGWNLAGLKAALAIPGADAAGELARLPTEVIHGATHFGVIAQTAALAAGERWLDTLLAGLNDNRRLLGELVGQHLPQVGYRPPEGTYLAWLDCRALAAGAGFETPDAPYHLFLDRARVALTAGHAFGAGGDGHVRLNFATSAAVLTEAVTRMGRVAKARD